MAEKAPSSASDDDEDILNASAESERLEKAAHEAPTLPIGQQPEVKVTKSRFSAFLTSENALPEQPTRVKTLLMSNPVFDYGLDRRKSRFTLFDVLLTASWPKSHY